MPMPCILVKLMVMGRDLRLFRLVLCLRLRYEFRHPFGDGASEVFAYIIPVYSRVSGLEPGSLMANEPMGLGLGLLDCGFQGAFAVQVRAELFITHSRHGWQAQAIAAGEQVTDFFHEPRFDHGVDAGVGAEVKGVSGAVEADNQDGIVEAFFLDLLGEGHTGDFEDFKGADNAADVSGVDGDGSVGVNGVESVVEDLRAKGGGLFFQAGAEVGVGGDVGNGHALQETPDVEAAAADEDGDSAPRIDVIHGEVGLLKIEGEVEGLVGVHEVVEMMGSAVEVLGRGFGGADIHVSVDLAAVGVDYLAAEGLGEIQREGALTGGGGPDYGD